MSSLRYAGSISIPVEITPRPQDTNGCIAIDNLHCTMLLPSQLRVLKELVGLSNMGLRQWVEGVIEQIAEEFGVRESEEKNKPNNADGIWKDWQPKD